MGKKKQETSAPKAEETVQVSETTAEQSAETSAPTYVAAKVEDGKVVEVFTAEEVAAGAETTHDLEPVDAKVVESTTVEFKAEVKEGETQEQAEQRVADEVLKDFPEYTEKALDPAAQAEELTVALEKSTDLIQGAALQVDDISKELKEGILRNNHHREGHKLVNELGFAYQIKELTDPRHVLRYYGQTGLTKEEATEKLAKFLAEAAHILDVKGLLALGGIALYHETPTEPAYAAFAFLGLTASSAEAMDITYPGAHNPEGTIGQVE